MNDEHYLNPQLVEIYDLENTWSADNDFYISLAKEKIRVLDLGCGTGLLANAYADSGCEVVAVDPSPAMIEFGKKKYPNKNIDWVISSAQSYRSDKKFDLIIMSGHTFQTLTSDSDIQKTFETVKLHLDEKGVFAFETRNPVVDWIEKWSSNGEKELNLRGNKVRVATDAFITKDELLSFKHHYRFVNQEIVSESTLRFASEEKIKDLLSTENIEVVSVYGNWNKEHITAGSPEMIFITKLK